MKYIFLILSLHFLIACSNTSLGQSQQTIADKSKIDTIRIDKLPEIGDSISNFIRLTSNKGQLVNSSQISPSTTIYYKDFIFDIAWDKEGKVNFIVTSDSNFMTKEKVKPNMTLKEIKDIQKVNIIKMIGWGYYLKLESGWNVGFCVDESCTGRELVEKDRAKFIFKR